MSELKTFELCNIDPDDISNVLIKVQKSFHLKFSFFEFKDVKTFGELCNIITAKFPHNHLYDCTTQQAFYKLRSAIEDALLINKNYITPRTGLQNLFPRKTRRKSISAIEKRLGFKTGLLRPKHSITSTFIIMLLVSFIGVFIFWQAAIVALILSIIGQTLATRFANELDIQTVGQFAEIISREHYLKCRRISETANRYEIEKKIKELFLTELGLEEHQLTRQTSFI